MSDSDQSPRPLAPIERRLLGVLVEKALTTPDSYPLTANAAVNACNQKSNRHPVTNYQAHDVDDALLNLKAIGLAIQVFAATGRTERWKHNLREAWGLDRPAISVLAELFLRGPQSEGDLRARASRMSPLASLDDLRTVLAELARRGFVKRLSPDGRKRGVIWAHLLVTDRERPELDAIEAREASAGDDDEARQQPASPGGSTGAIDELRQQVSDLESRLADLEERFRQFTS